MKFSEMKNKNWFPYTVAVCIGVILYTILNHLTEVGSFFAMLYGFIAPVFIGIVIAYIINPLVNFLDLKCFRVIKKEKPRHLLAVIIALFVVVLVLSLLFSSLIPQLADSASTFAGNIDIYTEKLQSIYENLNSRLRWINLDLSVMLTSGTDILNGLKNKLPDYANAVLNASSAVGSHVINWVLGLILAVYFLFDKQRMAGGLQKLIRLLFGARYDKFAKFCKRCNDIMVKYIVCELAEAVVIYLVNFIFMLIARMPYAVLISVIVGVSNMIPTFGPIIGCLIGAFILVLVDPVKALIFIIFTLILQTVDGYVLKPKMYGDTLGVPSILILIFIIVGGKIFGVLGILLAIPVAAIISFSYHEAFIPWLEKRQQKKKES